MKLIGLTGGIATGKSTVSNILKKKGFVVLDADVFAREVVEPGTFGLRSLVEIFGREILDGEKLNRGALGKIIFNDESLRLVVERLLHPLIQWRFLREADEYARAGKKMIFYDAALIFEKNQEWRFDKMIVVKTPVEVQIERFVGRNKISREDAEKRLAAQWPLDKKVSLAHYLVDNGASVGHTEEQVELLLKRLATEV